MESLIGVAFGPYVVVEKLGEGRHGATYKGYQEGLDRYIAIKVFRPELSRRPEFLEQLRQQILAAAKLSHPNILHIYSAGIANGVCFVVMDLALGGSLKTRIQGLPMAPEVAVSIARQLADALDYAHREGVAHGDIRTENVLMTRDARPLLADFGIAPALEGLKLWSQQKTEADAPVSLVLMDTNSAGSDRRSDLSALGAVLYEMLTGHAPLSRQTDRDSEKGRRTQTQDKEQLERAGVPEWLVAVVIKSLLSPAEMRYERAQELSRDLESRKPSPLQAAPAARNSARPRRLTTNRRLAAFLLLCIVGLAAALAVGVVALSGREDSTGRGAGPGTGTLTLPAPSAVPTTFTTISRPATSTAMLATAIPAPTEAVAPLATLASSQATATLAPSGTRIEAAAPTAGHDTEVPSQTAAIEDTVPPAPSPTTEETQAAAGEVLTGRIVFSAYDADLGGYRLFLFGLDSGNLQAIADFAHQPEFGPDGQRLVVDGLGGGRDDLWSLRADGSDWRQLTHHPDDQFPTWFPDATGIAFSSTRQGDGVYRLYLNDQLVRTSVTHQIPGDYPVMLPTGEIVFSGCNYGWGDGSRCGLWRVIDGALPAQITGNPQDIPTDGTGRDVLFLRSTAANWDVYRIPREGGDAVRLTDDPGRDGPAAFSADGKHVAFLSEHAGTWALYAMTRAGANLTLLLDLPGGGDLDAGPSPWFRERITWGP